MPERPERRDRPVDIVALRLRVAAGRMMAVGQRHLARRGAGSMTGSLPPGFTAPVEDAAMASGPASPGTHASRIAAQWRGGPLDARAAGR